MTWNETQTKELNADFAAKMQEPFHPNDLDWRIAHAVDYGELKVTAFAYVTNRAIMNRLDDIVGPLNWQSDISQINPVKGQDGFLSTISILDPITGDWVRKTDGADTSDIEPIKGGISGAGKRAGVSWGIGRYLYSLPDSTVVIHDRGIRYAKVKPRGGNGEVKINWSPPALPGFALPEERFHFHNMQEFLVENYKAEKHAELTAKVGFTYRNLGWLMGELKKIWGLDYYLTLAAYEAVYEALAAE